MNYVLGIVFAVVLIVMPQAVTTANRASKYVPKRETAKVTKLAFHDKIAPQVLVAIQNAKNAGLKTPLPSLLIAQIVHESAYGKSYLSRYHNYNGIRAKGDEPYILAYDDGAMRKFRRFNSLSESVTCAIRVMNKQRYKGIFSERSTYGQALVLQRGFYASDRKYAKKIAAKAKSLRLQKYDK